MKSLKDSIARALGATLLVGCAAYGASAIAAPAQERSRLAPGAHSPPLEDWEVDREAGVAEVRAKLYANAKAPQDKATVFRPVAPCRLVDTRGTGTGGAFVINGPLAPNSSTNVSTNGLCGIPTSFVAGLSLSFHVQNATVNNGGYISFLQQGAPVSGTNAVFNFGAVWTAATANVSIPNSSGDFAVFIALSQVELVVDVNGYYQDLNSLDVGTQQLDLTGSTPSGATFGFRNSSDTGTAVDIQATGTALSIGGGRIRVAGAGANTNEAAFVHVANASANFGTLASSGNLCSGTALGKSLTIIDHPYLNNNPNALLFLTPSGTRNQIHEPFYVTDNLCASAVANNKWAIAGLSQTAYVTGDRFNVLIINP